MSWFGTDTPSLVPPGVDLVAEDETLDLEIEDGVVVERRCLLRVSAAAVAAALVAPGLRAQRPQRADDDLDIRGFLKDSLPLARKLIENEGKGEEAYILSIAAILSQMTIPDNRELRAAMQEFRRQHGADRGVPISAVLMRLKPGSGFDHHDHRNYNGVILGVEGEVRIRNFDILGDELVPPRGQTFQIRETRDDLILPGRFSTLALRRDNVHELVAGPEGARVLDVFTRFARGSRSYMMTVDEKPRDAGRRIYDAAWS